MRVSTILPLLACVALAAAPAAKADAYCSETVTLIIVKAGAVYFTTSKSCQNWCELNPAWDANTINRSVALMIAAKTTGSPMMFEWPDQSSSCSNTEQTYSEPGAVIM